ncbi:MAG: class I SAM-dependent methyltransferase, partial [bacterium]|nr:class I SAM-dependent methyltransferase [bacterium]
RGLALSGESQDFFARGRVAWVQRWLAEHDNPAPGVVIDFGCGPGSTTTLLAEAFPATQALGLDVSAECVARARREHSDPRVGFEQVDDSLSSHAPADLLYCNGVMHHVPPADRLVVVRRMVSLVRPGGHVCVFENNPWNPGVHWVMKRIPFDRDARMLTAGSLRRLFGEGGIEVRATAYLFFFPRWLRRLRVLEPFLSSVPMGGQYAVIGRVTGA